jgi:two-component system LytT family response regulator
MQRKISTLLVDDEPPARRKLRMLLADWPTIEIAGEAGDGLAAVAAIEARKPELVLLDVAMPELDGFAVVEAIEPAVRPAVIFVTAHDTFALRAFDVGAIDYLLKPVTRDRLATALGRVLPRLERGSRADEAARTTQAVEAGTPRTPLERFVVRSLDRLRIVSAADVRWMESAGNYVKLHTPGGVHLVRGTLQELERRLDPTRFVRIHRTAMVALDRVRSLVPAGHGDFTALLDSGDRVPLSRRYRGRLPPDLFGR